MLQMVASTIQPVMSKILQIKGEMAGEAYAHLIKMTDEDPTNLQSLLERAELLLQKVEEGEIPVTTAKINLV